MKKIEIIIALNKFKKSFLKLKEGLDKENITELERDGLIQRFEFTFDTFWKTIKIFLKYSGFECSSPRECIKIAFKTGLIPNDEIFLDMLEDRNTSSHIYNEEIAIEIHRRIKIYKEHFEKSIQLLEEFTKKY